MNILFDAGLATWAYGLAAIGFAAFATQLGLGWRGGARGGWVLAAIALSCCWTAAASGYAYAGYYWLWIVANLFDALRLCAWFGFLLSLLFAHRRRNEDGHKSAPHPPLWIVASISLLIFAAFAFQSMPSLSGELLGSNSRLPPSALLALAIVGLMLVEQVFRNIPAHARWGIKPLCLGLGAAFCFDLYLYADTFLFNRLNIDVWTGRGIANLLIVPLIAVSTARNKDWALDIAVSRHIVFHSTTLFGSGLYLLAIAGAGYYVRYFGGSWGGALEVVFIFAGLLSLSLLFFSGSVRSKTRVLLNKHFFNYRYDYREEWLRFTQSLSAGDPQLSICEKAVKALADLVESPGGTLWLAEPSGDFRQVARHNMSEIKEVEPRDGALAVFLARTHWVIDLHEHQSAPQKYDSLALPHWLKSLPQCWLVVPLSTTGELFGFVVLLTSRASIQLNWEVLDLLKTAAQQAASYLAHMRATEALLEAKKFDSFNRMSAFVVHDVKNLVAQLSLLLKNAERHKDNPEFQADMLMTIDHVVERMKQLLLQLRAGTTPINQPAPVDLAALIGRIRLAKIGQQPVLTASVECNVEVLGHIDRLERVVGHLVQNAIDATPHDGRVWLKLMRIENRAVVEVGDTGHGMSPQFVRERLFKPFHSTKAAGMGIGAYESAQYIGELGGRLVVDSEENVGTVIRIELPASRADIQSDPATRTTA